VYKQKSAVAQLIASSFKQLSQYDSNPSDKAYCYTEHAISSPAMVVTVGSIHCTYRRRDSQAELSWAALSYWARRYDSAICCK